MDVDDILLTTLLYLEEIGKLRRWCFESNNKMLTHQILSREGNKNEILAGFRLIMFDSYMMKPL